MCKFEPIEKQDKKTKDCPDFNPIISGRPDRSGKFLPGTKEFSTDWDGCNLSSQCKKKGMILKKGNKNLCTGMKMSSDTKQFS